MVGAGVPGAEVRAAHHTQFSPPPPFPRLWGTPPRCVASPSRAGPTVSKTLLPLIGKKKNTYITVKAPQGHRS